MRLTPNEASHLAYAAFFRRCCRMELFSWYRNNLSVFRNWNCSHPI
jgi:hypothetical protein